MSEREVTSGEEAARAPGAAAGRGAGRGSLAELAGFFLKLGITAFGGPAAHIAMMEDELVRRRGWLTREAFLDLLGAANLIPGPSSTELAIYIGLARAGPAGLALAGLCFILPSALIVGALAWAYVRFGTLPQMAGMLYGVKPVVIAIVVQALWRLGRAALKDAALAGICLVAVAASALGTHELLLLAAAGGLATLRALWTGPAGKAAGRGPGTHEPVARSRGSSRQPGALKRSVLVALQQSARRSAAAAARLVSLASRTPQGTARLAGAGPRAAMAGAGGIGGLAAPLAAFGLTRLFFVFLKVGALLFGSGYVLLAYLRADLVTRLGWLSERQLLDAVAVGQVTPGPVFTTATFIGYLLGGAPGALTATAGIFLPSFLLVAASGPLLPRLRGSPLAGAFLDGVNAASVALVAVVTWQLGRAALVDPLTIGLAAASTALLLATRLSSSWLVLAGAAAGLLARGL